MTSDLLVAFLRMTLVSWSSTRKVDLPCMILSNAPTRVKMRSTGVMRHDSAGIQHPTCARMTAQQVWRRSVDLPPMFGPETRTNRAGFSSGTPISTSFAMKALSPPGLSPLTFEVS